MIALHRTTWDADAGDHEPQTQLFINGVKTGSMMSAAREPLGDWSGKDRSIGGRLTFTTDDLCHSRNIRYSDDFDPQTDLKDDDETLYLNQVETRPEGNR